jgi:hypothetical protein
VPGLAANYPAYIPACKRMWCVQRSICFKTVCSKRIIYISGKSGSFCHNPALLGQKSRGEAALSPSSNNHSCQQALGELSSQTRRHGYAEPFEPWALVRSDEITDGKIYYWSPKLTTAFMILSNMRCLAGVLDRSTSIASRSSGLRSPSAKAGNETLSVSPSK